MNDRVGAIFLLRGDGAALLQLRDNKPSLRHSAMWVPPGGHAELGEEMIKCAKREFFEETNYRCLDLNYLIEFEDLVEGWPAYQLTIYWSLYDGIQEVACNEGQDLQFICRHEMNKYRAPSYLLDIWDQAIQQVKFKSQLLS